MREKQTLRELMESAEKESKDKKKEAQKEEKSPSDDDEGWFEPFSAIGPDDDFMDSTMKTEFCVSCYNCAWERRGYCAAPLPGWVMAKLDVDFHRTAKISDIKSVAFSCSFFERIIANDNQDDGQRSNKIATT